MIEETGRLMHEMGITKEHAEEIINIYLECGNIDYRTWLKKQVRVFPAHEGTWKIAKKLIETVSYALKVVQTAMKTIIFLKDIISSHKQPKWKKQELFLITIQQY